MTKVASKQPKMGHNVSQTRDCDSHTLTTAQSGPSESLIVPTYQTKVASKQPNPKPQNLEQINPRFNIEEIIV